MKKIFTLAALLAIVVTTAIWQRHRLLISTIGSGEPLPLLAAVDEGPLVAWHDDYFITQELGPRTFAIGEPRYAQQNFSYLIIGSTRAVLFDAGPGFRDIRAVAESLTDQPITFVPSHFHYDHTGNTVTFDRVAVVDLPYLRERAVGNSLALTWAEHLGSAEGVTEPVLVVDEWLAPNSVMSLGDRSLRVLYTPGHTEDSISLLDMDSGVLFSGDFIYPGPLYAFLPTSGMGDYLQGAETVLATAPEETRIFGAHRVEPPAAPELSMDDVKDLHTTLAEIRSGQGTATGFYPREYLVNDRMQLLAEPEWLQNWVPRHPPVSGEVKMNPDNNAIAEGFISAFYSWDATKLKSLMTEEADAVAILYYQAWAEAANYKVKVRSPCKVEAGEVVCAITVTDDFGSAMGYEATDTFRMTLAENRISAVTFSGDDPPVFQELFQWISQNHPDILAGPCLNMFAGGETPGDCARVVAEAAREFIDERGESTL